MSGIISIVIGAFTILYAFGIKYFPRRMRIRKPFRLVSLWNREPFSPTGWKSKYYVDVANNPELQRLYFVNYLVTGVLFILSGLIGLFFDINVAYFMLLAAGISGFLFLYAKQRATGEIEVWKWVLLAVLFLGVVIGWSVSYKESKVEVLAEKFSVSGDYGIEVPYQAIDSVLVVDELPATKYCKAGYSFGASKKGKFRLKDGTDATFYVLGKEKPYLKLYTYFGFVIVNCKTTAETEQLIEELKPKIGEKLKTKLKNYDLD